MKGVSTPYPDPFLRKDREKVFYFSFIDPRTGKRRQRSTRCTRKADAIREIKKFVDRLTDDDTRHRTMSFGEYAADFYVDGKCPRQERLTAQREPFGRKHMYDQRRSLEYVIGREGDNRKKPYKPNPFAGILVGQITRDDVYQLRQHVSVKPGGRQGQQVFKAVTVVLSEAVEHRHLDRSPAEGIGPYKRPETDSGEDGAIKERSAFTQKELQTLWQHRRTLTRSTRSSFQAGPDKTDPRAPIALSLLLCLGLRGAELRALRWKHINMEQGYFSIVEAVKGNEAGSPIGPPKWNHTRKNLKLPAIINAELIEYRATLKEYGEMYVAPDAPVIPSSKAVVVGYTYIKKLWARIKERSSKLPEDERIDWSTRWLTPHSCRHSLNTLLLISDAPPFQVQEFLGWESEIGKSLARMQKHYAHLELGGTDKVASMIDELIGVSGSESQLHA